MGCVIDAEADAVKDVLTVEVGDIDWLGEAVALCAAVILNVAVGDRGTVFDSLGLADIDSLMIPDGESEGVTEDDIAMDSAGLMVGEYVTEYDVNILYTGGIRIWLEVDGTIDDVTETETELRKDGWVDVLGDDVIVGDTDFIGDEEIMIEGDEKPVSYTDEEGDIDAMYDKDGEYDIDDSTES